MKTIYDIASEQAVAWGLIAQQIDENFSELENKEVEVDDQMLDTSANAVQNKVVKAYVDGKLGDINTILETIIAG